MLYVLDDERGRIDICELLEFDVVFIRYLLNNETKETDNLNIRDRARRLADELKAGLEYELAWADVFLISTLLLNESICTNNPKTEEKADHLLAGFEAASKNIIGPTVPAG